MTRRMPKPNAPAIAPTPPKLTPPPREAKPAEVLHYANALHANAINYSRVEPVAAWRERVKVRQRPDHIGVRIPKRELYSLKATEGVLARRCGVPTRHNGQPCRMVCVKGMNVCYFHGGRKEIERRNAQLGIPILQGRAFNRAVRKLKPYLTPELRAEPAYQWAWANHPRSCRDLIFAWLAREAGDYEKWAAVIARLRLMGFS